MSADCDGNRTCTCGFHKPGNACQWGGCLVAADGAMFTRYGRVCRQHEAIVEVTIGRSGCGVARVAAGAP